MSIIKIITVTVLVINKLVCVVVTGCRPRTNTEVEIMFIFCSGGETTKAFGHQQEPAGMPVKSKDIENESEKQFDWLSVIDDRQAIVCRSVGVD